MRRHVITSHGQGRDCWREIKKLESKNQIVPNVVDGFMDDGVIANSFAKKYKTFYQSVLKPPQEITDLRRQITDDLRMKPHHNESCVTLNDVKKSLSRLRYGKSNGIRGTDSDHFIYCSAKFQILVSALINSMFIHGHTPTDLLESVLLSIPRDVRGNMSSNENYRGIALCSALCKILDLIILDKYKSKLATSGLQDAFNTEHSTNICASVMKEVCSYYKSRRTDCIYVIMYARRLQGL